MKKIVASIFLFIAVLFAVPAMAQDVESFVSALRWITSVPDGMPAACWFCPLYKEIFIIMNDMATISANALASFFSLFLWLGAAFFVVFYFGKLFVSLKELSMGDMLRGLAVPVGKIMIAAMLVTNFNSGTGAALSGSQSRVHTVYYFLINPALMTSLALGKTFMGEPAAKLKEVAEKGVQLSPSRSRAAWQEIYNLVVNRGNCTSSVITDLPSLQNSAFYSNDTYRAVQCLMGTASLNLAHGLAMGIAIFDWACDSVLKRFKALWIGLLIAGCYFFLLVFVGMKLIDPLVRLTIVSALMPLWIALWALPATAGYAKKAWETLINVMGTFIFFSVVMAIIVPVMSKAMGNDENRFWAQLITETINSNSWASFGWKQTLWCLGYTLVCFQMLNSVESLVQTFAAGGADMGIAKALEGLTMKITALGANLVRGGTNLTKATATGVVTGTRYGVSRFRAWRESRSSSGSGSGGSGGGGGGGGGP